MIILKEHSLTPKDVVNPVSMKLDLIERSSSAQPEFATGEPPEMVDWVMTTEWPANGIVWRVRDLDDQTTGTGKWSMKLEHVIGILEDVKLRGQIKTETLAGKKGAQTCDAETAFRYVLNKQKTKDWKLGNFAFRASEPFAFNGGSILDALQTITASLEGAYWELNTTKYPFTIDVLQRDESVGGEMRYGRNITGVIKKTITRAGMYTVIIPIGKNNLKLPEGSLSRNVDLYGSIEHDEVDQGLDTVDKLRSWAKARLRKHCEPTVSITVNGLNLSQDTGEDLDDIKLNRVCRIPLPKWGKTIKEHVTKLSWPDCIKEPKVFTVTLANNETDVTSIIKQAVKGGGGGAGGRDDAANAEEDHAWFEDTTDHVSMVAMAIIGKDPDGDVDWKRVADITVDGEGIHSVVTALKGDVKEYGTRIDQNEKGIGLVVGTYDNGGQYIKAGEICLAINDSNEAEATIRANKIYLLGQTIANQITADYIKAKISNIATLMVNAMTMTGGLSASGDIRTSGTLGGYDLTCRGQDMREAIISATVDGNTLKLKNCKGDETTFSKATTLSGEWSGNQWIVTASPQGNQLTSDHIQVHPVSSQGGDYTDVYVGTTNGSSWSHHGNAARLTLSFESGYAKLKDGNGSTLAQKQNDWSYSNTASQSSSSPGNAAKTYNVSKGYDYAYFNVTVNGESKRIVVHMMNNQ